MDNILIDRQKLEAALKDQRNLVKDQKLEISNLNKNRIHVAESAQQALAEKDSVIKDLEERLNKEQNVINIDWEDNPLELERSQEEVTACRKELENKDAEIAQLTKHRNELIQEAYEQKTSEASVCSSDGHKDAEIAKLKKTIQTQKDLLNLKKQEINLLTEQQDGYAA